MFTVKGTGTAEIIVRKSKFIANVYPVDNQREATELINKIKKEYWDAKHNVYAYKIKGDTMFCKYTDDGEPQGTAGLPIMNLIEKKKLQNILIVVTRYFGGTLLGTGGLVKAYSETAKKGIEDAGIIEIVDKQKLEIDVSYEIKDRVSFFLENNGYTEKSVYFGETVKITLNVPVAEIDIFYKKMLEITEGKCRIQKL